MAGIQVFCVVISKLSYWYEPDLVILLEVYKALEVHFHGIVLLLNLTVNLRVKSSK